MSRTTEERLAAAMHAAVPDLVPSPMLADRARSTARRSHRLAAAGMAGTLVALAVVVGAAVWWSEPPFPAAADLPPEWARCDRMVADDLPAPLVREPVSIAVCGELDRPEAVPVWIGDASIAREVVDRLRSRKPGSWIDAYGTITYTPFAVLGADGSVSRLGLTWSSEDGQMISGNGHSWIVDADLLSLITSVRTGEPSFVDPPRPFAFDGLSCPDDVARDDWLSTIASPEPGDRDRVEPSFDEMVICAYHPYNDSGPVRVVVGIGHEEDEAAHIVGSIEEAPLSEQPIRACNYDAGLAYVILLGSGGELSTVLYAEAFGCNVVADVTPGRDQSERMRLRVVTRDLASILLEAVGPENVR